jgi:hypothetical protein
MNQAGWSVSSNTASGTVNHPGLNESRSTAFGMTLMAQTDLATS